MKNIMDEELHLPWDNNALESLLLKIIQTGETTKVDFKVELNLDTADQRAELLKDISAFANTYDDAYRNHGFILIGIKNNQIIGTSFPQEVDALQASLDQLIKTYIGPFIQTHVRAFNSDGKTWGVIVIPPTRKAPHVFIKDIANKYRGDIYVRRGTITEKAMPEDYPRFFRLHVDEYTYELKQQLGNLRFELNEIKKKLALVKKEKQKALSLEKPEVDTKKVLEKKASLNLLQEIENAFFLEEDPIKHGLIKEARKIQSFLESNSIPWALQIPSREDGEKLLRNIEEVSEIYWVALINIVLKDEKGKYDEAIIQSLGYLARYYEAPVETSYNNLGINIRYYPLIVSLYIIFIVGAFKKRQTLLKKVADIELLRRSLYEEPYHIAYSLFFIRRAEEVFQTQHGGYPKSRWCDAVASYTKTLLDRKVHIDDCFWDKDANFYIGEFLLSLLPLDIIDKNTGTPIIGHPSSGLFIYINDSIPAIRRFLKNENKWVAKIFRRPFEDILKEFDETPKKLERGGCWAEGFVSGAFETVFPEKAKIEKVKKF